MKRIVIVGATSGIGLEVAKLCIREGWRVGAAGRREEALEALRATAPEQVETEPLDITRDDAPGQLARLIDKLGGMDIYLHCSGIGKRNTGLLPEIELDTLRTNGEGFVRMVTAAFGYFRANGGGHLAVISSCLLYTSPSPRWRSSRTWKTAASALRTSARVSSPPRCWQATGTTRC